MYSAANRKDVRAAEKAARLAEANRGVVLVAIMSSTEGRAWVYDLLAGCHIFHNPFSADDRLTAFACGEMNAGQRFILDPIMRHCPDSYIQMLREANERSTIAEHARGSNRDGRDQGSGGPAEFGEHDPRDEDGAGDEDRDDYRA